MVVKKTAARYARRRGNLIYVWGSSAGRDWETLHASVRRPDRLEFRRMKDAVSDCPVALAVDFPETRDDEEPLVIHVGFRRLFRPRLVARWDGPGAFRGYVGASGW